MSLEKFRTQVLLLHSEQSTLDNLSTGFNERYTVHCATSGSEALSTLGEISIHVLVSAQDLPGMSGLDALREAKRRSPDTIGILLAGASGESVAALVGDQEVFQIVHGGVTPESLRKLIDNATKQARLLAISRSANDTMANVDSPVTENIVMETSESGASIISDGTGRLPVLNPNKIAAAANIGSRAVDVLVLTKDDEFLSTVRESARGMHNILHASTIAQADAAVRKGKVGVAVVDAAVVSGNVEKVTMHLRTTVPRLVAIVAGRRDDGEMLMDLINRGKVYRFLLKPVSPGRARLAIEASVKHHLEAPDSAFKSAAKAPIAKAKRRGAMRSKSVARPMRTTTPPAEATSGSIPTVKVEPRAVRASKSANLASPMSDRLSSAFGDEDKSLIDTVTRIIKSVGAAFSDRRKTDVQDSRRSATGSSAESSFSSPRILGMGAAGLVVVVALGWWVFGGSDKPVTVEHAIAGTPLITEADPVLESLAPAPAKAEVIVNELLSEAESSLLASRAEDASAALQRVGLIDPDNPRLPFLNAQLAQMQLRHFLSDSRLAIRESRFEDATVALDAARALRISGAAEIDTVTRELSSAVNEQRADDVLARAKARLEEGKLIAPSNDNARYYYELALSNDRQNVAARQGLTAVASKLVLRARAYIDNGDFDTADILLADARRLDPSSSELAVSTTTLSAARERLERERRAVAQQAEDDRAAEVLAANERAAEVLAANERAAAELAANERAAAELAANQRAAAELAANQRAAAELAANQRAEELAANQRAAEKLAAYEQLAAADQAAGTDVTTAATVAAQDDGQVLQVNDSGAIIPVVNSTTTPVGISALNRIKYVAPKYPRAAQRRNVSGWVDVVFTVDIDGSVKDVYIRESNPGTTFVSAAVNAVENWKFEPVTEGGVTIQKRAAVRMMFALE